LKDEYKFKVILDGEIEETCKMFPYPWTSVEISINKAEGSSPPLFVGVVTV
jgi:hypothetical protein